MYVKIKKNLGKCLLDIVVVKSVACGRLVAHWSGGGSEGLIVKRMSRVAVVLHDLTAYGLAAELKMSGVKKMGKGTVELQFHASKESSIYGDDLSCTVGTSCSCICSSPVIKMLGCGSCIAYQLFMTGQLQTCTLSHYSHLVSATCMMNIKNMNLFIYKKP